LKYTEYVVSGFIVAKSVGETEIKGWSSGTTQREALDKDPSLSNETTFEKETPLFPPSTNFS